jgi:G3E family GTPase
MNTNPGPKIVAVYGFLGSGKTTVMMQLARKIVSVGSKAAIVVNEAGDIPIDGKLLDVGGFPVKEIFAGCICCQAVGDFIGALKALQSMDDLDYILIEPSGMAEAPSFFSSVQKHVTQGLTKALVLDGPRLLLLLKAARPLITSQIKTADLILLNKTDAVDKSHIPELERAIKEFAPDTPVHHVSAKNGAPDALLAEML